MNDNYALKNFQEMSTFYKKIEVLIKFHIHSFCNNMQWQYNIL